MASRGCIGCGLDKKSSYRLYFRQHSQAESSFVPSELSDSGSLVSTSVNVSAPTPLMGEPGEGSGPREAQVHDSQDNRHSAFLNISSGERELYRGFRLDNSSDMHYLTPAAKTRAAVQASVLPSPPLPPRIRSGFNSQPLDQLHHTTAKVIPALPLSRQHHEFMVHTRERRGNTPAVRSSSAPPVRLCHLVRLSYTTPRWTLGLALTRKGPGSVILNTPLRMVSVEALSLPHRLLFPSPIPFHTRPLLTRRLSWMG